MAQINIEDTVYVTASDIEVDDVGDIIDIMDNNYIKIIEVLQHLDWELPDFQEAARQLDLEYRPACTTGASLLSLFKKMEVTEQREFLSMITDAIISYYRSDLTVTWPSDLQ